MPESRALRSSRRREDIRRCCRHIRLLLNSRQSLKHAEVLGDIYRLTDKNASPFRALLTRRPVTRRPCAVGKIRVHPVNAYATIGEALSVYEQPAFFVGFLGRRSVNYDG